MKFARELLNTINSTVLFKKFLQDAFALFELIRQLFLFSVDVSIRKSP
jgi:hypothetical protein